MPFEYRVQIQKNEEKFMKKYTVHGGKQKIYTLVFMLGFTSGICTMALIVSGRDGNEKKAD